MKQSNHVKILYVHPTGVSGPLTALLERNGHEVMCVARPSEALDMIDAGRFSAVLIAEEIEDSEAIEFIYKVHCPQPELLVFQLGVWRSELEETLELLETVEERGDAPQQ